MLQYYTVHYTCMQCTVRLKTTHTQKWIYAQWNGPSETKPNPENCWLCSYVCAVHCVQLLHTILHRTDLIIFPLASRQSPLLRWCLFEGKGCQSEALFAFTKKHKTFLFSKFYNIRRPTLGRLCLRIIKYETNNNHSNIHLSIPVLRFLLAEICFCKTWTLKRLKLEKKQNSLKVVPSLTYDNKILLSYKTNTVTHQCIINHTSIV